MMISWVSCPRCGELVDPQTRTCQNCGASLALAALLAERALTNGSMGGSLIPMSPEILVPRLGDFLIERGILKPEDLQKA
ncbi:MAG: zinc ribbon domain-containing protein, partial [Anaerolineales bacterium]|nr:zinc ribbon domain-containing protein [Anaerolineales bacterium]